MACLDTDLCDKVDAIGTLLDNVNSHLSTVEANTAVLHTDLGQLHDDAVYFNSVIVFLVVSVILYWLISKFYSFLKIAIGY